MQNEAPVRDVRILVEMINAVGVQQRGAALNAMHFIAFAKQELRQIGAVLTRDAGDQCNFLHGFAAMEWFV